VAVGCIVAVGEAVLVAVGTGVFVEVGYGVIVGVGHGVAVGTGVAVGGASRVSTALAVARAALTTAVASSQPGTVHCARATDGESATNRTNTATIFVMV
jgi:hypothetical protein